MQHFDADRQPETIQSSTAETARLEIAYDGSDFHGFAASEGVRTVAGELLGALGQVLQFEPELTCAGRTDKGVHALGQVVSFPLEKQVDLSKLQQSLNSMLGPEIVVKNAQGEEAGFNARYSARSRCYRYYILNRPQPDPFQAKYSWWVSQPLDLARLRQAAIPFVGEHDFSSFCRKDEPEGSLVRRVDKCEWTDLGDGLMYLEVVANAFCWQMIRSLVGTMVDVGLGKLKAGDITAIIDAKDRSRAGRVAPPQGLFFVEVCY